MLDFLTKGVVHYLIIIIPMIAIAALGLVMGMKIRGLKDAGESKKALTIGIITIVIALGLGIGGGAAIRAAMASQAVDSEVVTTEAEQ